MPTQLCDLPQELILEIFELLDGKTLVRACAVCRIWKVFIQGSVELQYTIELWADGMIAGLASTEPAAERLEALLTHRAAWTHLNYTTESVIPLLQPNLAYDLTHGWFAQISDGVFSAVRLPSVADPTVRHIRSELGVQSPRDFVMDPTQDLVAFLYKGAGDLFVLQCRSLSSPLHTHPLATVPSLPFSTERVFPLSMDIADDVISVLVRFSQVLLFDWRRGKVLQDIRLEHYISSFNFLSPRAFILTSTINSGHIEIWKFALDGETTPPTHMATLQLPATAGGGSMINIIAHSNPFRANPVVGKSYSKSNERRLYAFSLEYELEDDSIQYCLFLHHHYLLSYLSKLEASGIVAWDQWGSQHSCMMRGMWNYRWIRHVHGERVVFPRDVDDPSLLNILDFSPEGSRNESQAAQANSAPLSEFDPYTLVLSSDVFQGDIITKLPFRRMQRTFENSHDNAFYMIDEEQIIGVQSFETRITVYMI